MVKSLTGPEAARAERSKRFQSQLKDITGEGENSKQDESELAAEKLKNQQLTFQLVTIYLFLQIDY